MTFSTGWCRSSQAQDAEEGKAYSWKVWYRRNECETRPSQWPWYIFSGGWVWSGHFRWRGEVTYTSLSFFFFFFLLRALNKIMQNVYYEVSEMNAELQDIPVLSSECAWSSRWTVVIGPRPVVYFFPFSFPPAFTLYSATRFPRVTNGKTCFKTL